MSHKRDDRILVGTRKGLFTLAPDGAGWAVDRADFEGDNVPMVLADPRDGAIYAVLDHGHFGIKLHRSDDGGASYQEIATPAFPREPEDKDPNDVSWTVKLIWELAAGGPDQPGLLWIGTIPGGLFRSQDRGESWALVRSLWDKPERREWFGGGTDLPGIHTVVVDPRDSKHVTVAISCGGIWVTRDGGQSWTLQADGMRAEYMPPEQAGSPNTQDPHRLVSCPATPDRLWVQHHNGIFRSDDAAESWVEIKDVAPSTFGFAVAVHPADPDTAWFVPGVKDEKRIPVGRELVVTRTRDGGQSFERLTAGLPQAWAYDLVYRHCLDVDTTGVRLAFGSTTGNVWTSGDGGDSWQAVSGSLPPVYCLRFG